MKDTSYEDLEIHYADRFRVIWSDRGSGAQQDGAFYAPVLDGWDGFHPLGSLAVRGYADPSGRHFLAVVRDMWHNENRPALRTPDDFELVWRDKGSGAYRDGSMWRPLPPDGYVAMGLVCNAGYGKPDRDSVCCVRHDLVAPAKPGGLIWWDKGSGADRDFAAWEIEMPEVPQGERYAPTFTFLGTTHYGPDESNPNAYVLRSEAPRGR